MFIKSIYNHQSLSWNFVAFNLLAFIFIKLAFSSATFQLATLLDATPAFDSREIVSATNIARAAHGLPSLASNYKLDLAAREKLEHMANNEYFAHISPSGVTPWYWIKEANYSYIVAGENLAIGFSKAQDTVDAWLESSSHRANMLGTSYRDIGVAVGVVEIEDTQGILVVQMFGASNEQVAVAGDSEGTNTPVSPNQGQPIPSVTSAGVVQVENPAPTPIIGSSEPVIALQYVSTDESISPISEPIRAQAEESEDLLNLSDAVRNIYVWYAFLLTIVSILIAVFVQRTKLNLLKAAIHMGVLLGSVFIPSLEPIIRASIF